MWNLCFSFCLQITLSKFTENLFIIARRKKLPQRLFTLPGSWKFLMCTANDQQNFLRQMEIYIHILRHMYRRRQTWETFAQISSEWVPKICFRFYGLQLSKFYAVRGELMPSYICVAFSKRNPFVNFLWLIHSHSFCIKNRFQNYTTSLPRKNQQKKFSLYLNPQTSAPSRKKEQEKQFSFVSCFILVLSPFERLLINGIIYKKFIA